MKKIQDKKDFMEKVYITRDEDSDFICIWRKPKDGVWKPIPLKDCDIVNYQRVDRNVNDLDTYIYNDFKRKFNINIRKKEIKSVRILKSLLDNEDYKLFSNDSRRKK